MRHYEIVLMLRPDHQDQILGVIDYYKEMVFNSSGKIYRVENWGCRQLAYPIKKLRKAYYVLLNVEVSQDIIIELNNNFRFNEIVIRSMIMRMKQAILEPSFMMKKPEELQEESLISEK